MATPIILRPRKTHPLATLQDDFTEEAKSSMAAGERHFIVDMSETPVLTSTVLGLLLALRKHTTETRGRLILCCLNPRAQYTLVVTETKSLFEIKDSLDEATAQFKGTDSATL